MTLEQIIRRNNEKFEKALKDYPKGRRKLNDGRLKPPKEPPVEIQITKVEGKVRV